MFKKRDCPNCSNKIDDALEVCPKCGHVLQKRTNKVTFLPFWKQIVLFVCGFIGFQTIGLMVTLVMQLIAKATMSEPAYQEFIKSVEASAIVNFVGYFLIAIVLALVLFKDIKPLAKTFKHWTVPVSAIAGYGAIFTFNFLYNFILSVLGITIDNNLNEQTLQAIIKINPFLSLIVFAIIGPAVEEITYRVGFYSFFRRINKYLAFVLTIIVFSLIHFDFTTSNISNELLNLPFYIFAAFVFSFLYEKFGFASSLSAHITNNLISILASILTIYGIGK